MHQLQTRWTQSSRDDADGWTWLQLMCCATWIVGSCILKWRGQNHRGRTEVWSIPDWRVGENLVSKRRQNLVGNLVRNLVRSLVRNSWYLDWLYCTMVACFYNYWEQCRVASAARGVSPKRDYGIFGQGRWGKGMKRGGRAGLSIQCSKNRSKG